jgi:hypothetical protein
MAVGGGVEGGDEHAQGAGEAGLQPDDGAGRAQGVRDRDVLGERAREDHGQGGGEQEGEGGGEAAGEPVGHAHRGEAGADERGDGGLGDVAGDQRRDRDRQLAAGELERQVAVGAGDGAAPAVADGGGVPVDAAAFQGGEGELGRDGDGGAEGEGDDGEQAERGEQDGHGPSGRARGGPVRRLWTRSAVRAVRTGLLLGVTGGRGVSVGRAGDVAAAAAVVARHLGRARAAWSA